MTPSKVPVTVIIHTLNEEVNLPFAIENVVQWADQVCVVDSDSTDRTQHIAKTYGCELLSRPCERGGLVEQRNWALESIAFRNDWVFILDADETMEDLLIDEVAELVRRNDAQRDGYWCRFKTIFLGEWIRRSSMYPSWSLRLFRHAKVRYERREVNAHPMVSPEREGFLTHHLRHEDRKGFSSYLKRIDEFSSLEAKAYRKVLLGQRAANQVSGSFWGTRAERRRFLKNLFIRLPFRPIVIFIYLYLIRMGFLDGASGFHYCFLRCTQEWAINIKINELAAVDKNE